MSDYDLDTIRRVRNLARLAGIVVGMIAGIFYGTYLVGQSGGQLRASGALTLAAVLSAGLAGGSVLGLALPHITVDPVVWLRQVLDRAPTGEIAGAVAGLVIALVVSALVAVLLNGLPDALGALISLVLACVLVNVGVNVGRHRGEALAAALSVRAPGVLTPAPAAGGDAMPSIVVDTSVFIDGRLLDVVKTGFIQGRLLVPQSVLAELQQVADSSSALRRAKGRRGLDVLAALRDGRHVGCDVIEGGADRQEDVDVGLVALARARGAALMTTDHNLEKVARLEGVRVLNLNALATAIKPAVVAGQDLRVEIIRDGREPGQGVGYLEDGTMVIVEDGRGRDGVLTATVTKVLQTPSGRMVFATCAGDEGDGSAAEHASVPSTSRSAAP